MSDSLQPYGRCPPGSSIHGILQARILEWVAMSFYRGSARPRIEPMSFMSPALAGRFFTTSPTWEAQVMVETWKFTLKYIFLFQYFAEFETFWTDASLLDTRNPSYIIFESNEWWLLSIKSVKPIMLYHTEFAVHLTLCKM